MSSILVATLIADPARAPLTALLAGLPAGQFAGNSGKNSGFRQTGRVRRSFYRQNYCKFKGLTENRCCRRNNGEIRLNSGFRAPEQ